MTQVNKGVANPNIIRTYDKKYKMWVTLKFSEKDNDKKIVKEFVDTAIRVL
mgnify:CR=1 FL=1|jgi:hypothetical protein